MGIFAGSKKSRLTSAFTVYKSGTSGKGKGGVTKTRNGKRNGMENGMKRKKEMKFSKENKYMKFVDTTAYKGKRFEIN